MKPFRKSFLVPIYECRTTIVVADRISDLIADLNKEESKNQTSGAYMILEWPEAHILFRSDCLNEGVISHECDHLTHAIMRFVGLKECDESEEGFAYLNGWLSNQIHKMLKAAKIKID